MILSDTSQWLQSHSPDSAASFLQVLLLSNRKHFNDWNLVVSQYEVHACSSFDSLHIYIYLLWWHYKSKGQVVPNPYQGDPTFVFPQLFSIFSLVPKRSVNYQFCLGSFASLQTYCPTTLPYFRQDIRMFRQNVCMFRHPIFLGVDAFSFQQNRRVSNLSKW